MATSDDFSQDFGDTDDVLSLCDLPIHDYKSDDASGRSPRASTSSDQDPFEFCSGFGPELSRSNSVVFCGRIFDQAVDGDGVNEYRKRDYLCLKSASFHKAPPAGYQFNGKELSDFLSESKNRSSTLRSSGLRLCHYKQLPLVQKVNITAITSMSEKSRRRMFMFGPVKFKPEMDVKSIRMRQRRRPSLPMNPLPEGRELVELCGRGKSGRDRGLLKLLWCRSHIATALAKSFGCISASMVLKNTVT